LFHLVSSASSSIIHSAPLGLSKPVHMILMNLTDGHKSWGISASGSYYLWKTTSRGKLVDHHPCEASPSKEPTGCKIYLDSYPWQGVKVLRPAQSRRLRFTLYREPHIFTDPHMFLLSSSIYVEELTQGLCYGHLEALYCLFNLI
jgi:hypothetical protein